MSVYKPAKSPFWQYDFHHAKRRYTGSTGATTKAAARRVEQHKRLEAALGRLHARDVPSLDVAAAEWFIAHQHLASADALERRLALAVRLIGRNKPVNEVTTADIANAIAKRRLILARGKAPANATVNRDIIDAIRPVIKRQRKLLNDGRAELVAFPEIDWQELRLEEPASQPRDFTDGEMGAFDRDLPPWWRDFARFAGRYGLRLGEMFFPLSAIDVAERRVTIYRRRKNGQVHSVPISAEDAAMLAARIGRATAAGLDTPWFRELKGRLKALTYHGGQKALGKAMTTAGLRKAKGARGAHDLRHHSAMRFLRATGNLRATQRLLGHASVQSTLVYAHAMEADVRAGLDAVARNSHEPAKDETETTSETKAVGGEA